MEAQDAYKNVLKEALQQRKLARGLNEAARALDSRNAVLCVLATNCNEDNYKKLIEALCSEHQIPLVKVDDNAILGQWAGLCKYSAWKIWKKSILLIYFKILFRTRCMTKTENHGKSLNAQLQSSQHGAQKPRHKRSFELDKVKFNNNINRCFYLLIRKVPVISVHHLPPSLYLFKF